MQRYTITSKMNGLFVTVTRKEDGAVGNIMVHPSWFEMDD